MAAFSPICCITSQSSSPEDPPTAPDASPTNFFRFVRISVGQSTPSIWQRMDGLKKTLKKLGGKWYAQRIMSPAFKIQFASEGIVADAEKPFDLFMGDHQNLFVYVHRDELLVSLIARNYNFDNIVDQFDILMDPLKHIIEESNPQIVARLQLPKLSRNLAKLIGVKDFYDVQIDAFKSTVGEQHLFNVHVNVEDSLEDAVNRVHSAVDELLMLETTA